MPFRFEPNQRKVRRDAVIVAIASFFVAPVYFWWRGFSSVVAGVLITVGAFVLLSARSAWLLYLRGLDTLVIDDEAVHLSRRSTSASFRFAELHRVYRFGETLVFESHAPHRRYVFLLEGHDEHAKEIVALLASSARTMDLRWFDGVVDGL